MHSRGSQRTPAAAGRSPRTGRLRRALSLGGVVLATLAAWPGAGAAATYTATPSTLTAVLGSARDGDTIVLAKGAYKGVRIMGRTFRQPLVIDARAATLEGLFARSVSGLEIRGGEYRLSPTTTSKKSGKPLPGFALRFVQVENIKVSDISVVGPGAPADAKDGPHGDGWGLQVNGGKEIEVANSRFRGLKVGITLARVTGFRVLNNQFSNQRSDGIDVAESRKGLIEGNDCRDTRIRAIEHPDCIQMWSRSTSPPTADITIRKNRVRGYSQGIGLFNHVRNGVNDGGFDRILIEDNDIEVPVPHGIAIMDSRDSIVRNNRVRTAPGAKHRTSINSRGAVKRCGNVVEAGAGRPGMVDPSC